jgi:hypothetical protein
VECNRSLNGRLGMELGRERDLEQNVFHDIGTETLSSLRAARKGFYRFSMEVNGRGSGPM